METVQCYKNSINQINQTIVSYATFFIFLIPNNPKSTTVQCATNLTFVQSATEQGNLETNHEKHSSLKLEPREPCPQRTTLDSLFRTCPQKPQ